MSHPPRAVDRTQDRDPEVGSVTGPGVIDWLPLQELAASFGADAPRKLAETVGTFRDSAPDLLRQVAAALDGPDLRTAERPAHALRGAAAFLGADRLAAAAGRLERGAQDGRPVVEMRLLLRRAAAELSYVEDALDHLPDDLC